MNAEHVGDPLDRPEREVSLAPLQVADVVGMETQQVPEGLLRFTAKLAVAPEVSADHSLQFAFHKWGRSPG